MHRFGALLWGQATSLVSHFWPSSSQCWVGGCVCPAEEALSHRAHVLTSCLHKQEPTNFHDLGLDELGVQLNQYTDLLEREVGLKTKWWWDGFKVSWNRTSWNNWSYRWGKARHKDISWSDSCGMLYRPPGWKETFLLAAVSWACERWSLCWRNTGGGQESGPWSLMPLDRSLCPYDSCGREHLTYFTLLSHTFLMASSWRLKYSAQCLVHDKCSHVNIKNEKLLFKEVMGIFWGVGWGQCS